MASKDCMFGHDFALYVIRTTDDPGEQKRLGRQVRHFDLDLWQQECEHSDLPEKLAKFSKIMRCALPLHTLMATAALPKPALMIKCRASA